MKNEARADAILMATVYLASIGVPDRELKAMSVTREGVQYKNAITVPMIKAAKAVMESYIEDEKKDGKPIKVAKAVVDAWKPTLGRRRVELPSVPTATRHIMGTKL